MKQAREGGYEYAHHGPELFMTVVNRSHDLLWGMLGANSVHFSVLQEYLAARLDAGIGALTFFSNNLHVYVDALERMLHGPVERATSGDNLAGFESSPTYGTEGVAHVPLFTAASQAAVPGDLERLWRVLKILHSSSAEVISDLTVDLATSFCLDVYLAARAHRWYRLHMYADAHDWARRILAPDWRLACTEWLKRRRREA